ncbi:MAG TPA: lysophospholipid acyltransferase family protein [Terriglobales bacterium]
MSTLTTPVSEESADNIPRWTVRQRLLLWSITWLGYLAIRLIGSTLRYSVHLEEGDTFKFDGQSRILCFWHCGIFTSTYVFRKQQIGVLSSHSFDGEYTSRIIAKFKYVPIKGSSTRGAVRGLLGCRRWLDEGHSVAFTSDGPRGPALVAKPGPVLLASKTGVPLVAFHVAIENPWRLRSWDKLMVPKPFSKALICFGKEISVPGNVEDSQMQRLHAELQAGLERVREFAEAHVHEVGKREYPLQRI